jgi:hypothetical protein
MILEPYNSLVLNGKQEAHMTGDLKKSAANWFLHLALEFITLQSGVVRLSANSKIVLENFDGFEYTIFHYNIY